MSVLRLRRFQKPWQEESLALLDCDVLFGCVDTYRAREELERAARRFLIPHIDIGMDVTPSDDGYVISGQVIWRNCGGAFEAERFP